MRKQTKFTLNAFMLNIWAMSGTDLHYLDFKAEYFETMKMMYRANTKNTKHKYKCQKTSLTQSS